MDLFQQLKKAVEEEYNHGDLPEELKDPLLEVSHHPEKYSNNINTVEVLLQQVKGFEPYCDCGCFAEGFNHKDLNKTLKQLHSGLGSDEQA